MEANRGFRRADIAALNGIQGRFVGRGEVFETTGVHRLCGRHGAAHRTGQGIPQLKQERASRAFTHSRGIAGPHPRKRGGVLDGAEVVDQVLNVHDSACSTKRRTAQFSSSKRSESASSISRVDSAVTKVPRRRKQRTRTTYSSRRSTSRAGVRLVPTRQARPNSRSHSPGTRSQARIARRRRS